jgi:hypothetical protein
MVNARSLLEFITSTAAAYSSSLDLELLCSEDEGTVIRWLL